MKIKFLIGLGVLTILVICLSLLIRDRRSPQADPILTVLRAQRAVAVKNCTPEGRLLLFPYAKRIAQIDATACPDDFFQAWQKYVADVQTMAAIRRADAGKAMVSVGAALALENPSLLLGALPKNLAEGEMSSNIAGADWQNVKHVALRYGIKITPLKYSQLHGDQHSA